MKKVNPYIKVSRREENAEIRKIIRKWEKQRAKLKKEGKLTLARKKYIDEYIDPLKRVMRNK